MAFCEWIKICMARTVHTIVRVSTSKLEHINAFVVIKLDHFMHRFQSWDNVFVIVPAQKVFE